MNISADRTSVLTLVTDYNMRNLGQIGLAEIIPDTINYAFIMLTVSNKNKAKLK